MPAAARWPREPVEARSLPAEGPGRVRPHHDAPNMEPEPSVPYRRLGAASDDLRRDRCSSLTMAFRPPVDSPRGTSRITVPQREHPGQLCRGATDQLRPSEEIQAVFLAKRPQVQWNDRAVVATNRRLLLFKVSRGGRPIEILDEADRSMRIGPCRGWMSPVDVFACSLAVNRRFFRDVADADRLAGF